MPKVVNILNNIAKDIRIDNVFFIMSHYPFIFILFAHSLCPAFEEPPTPFHISYLSQRDKAKVCLSLIIYYEIGRKCQIGLSVLFYFCKLYKDAAMEEQLFDL
jgi:hypothetical protein